MNKENISPSISNSSPLRVMVVDDNRDAAILMGRLLRTLGNDVQVAHDGFTALEVAEQFRPEAILLDIGLPEMDGYDTARMIRELPALKEVLIIAVTGWGQEEDKEKGKQAGFDHHVVKPADSATLMQLLSGARNRMAVAV
jgi:CheY-like chemotaxis protein